MRDLKPKNWKAILPKKGSLLLSRLVLVVLFGSSVLFGFLTPLILTLQGMIHVIVAVVYFLFITFLVGWLFQVYYIPAEGKRSERNNGYFS